MGWSSGSQVLGDVWATVRYEIPDHRRVEVLAKLMSVFAHYDCDTLMEIECPEWPEARLAYRAWYKQTCGEEYPDDEEGEV